MTTLAELTRNPSPVDTLSPHPLVVSLERVGIEVELEGVTQRGWNSSYWNAIPDGSLRNNGIEYVTRGSGIGGKDLFRAITEIDGYLYDVKPESTWRCSTHVHVDARNMTVQQIKNFILIYSVFERTLFKCSGWQRYKNNFCLALGTAQQLLKRLAYHWDKTDMDFLNSICSEWNKYTAINLLPLLSLGTIELRMSEAKWRKGHLVKLVNRFLAIKQFAMQWEGSEKELIEAAETADIAAFFRKGLPSGTVPCDEDQAMGAKFAGDIINTSALLAKQHARRRQQIGSSGSGFIFEISNASQLRGIDRDWCQDHDIENRSGFDNGDMLSASEVDILAGRSVNIERLLSAEDFTHWRSVSEYVAERESSRSLRTTSVRGSRPSAFSQWIVDSPAAAISTEPSESTEF